MARQLFKKVLELRQTGFVIDCFQNRAAAARNKFNPLLSTQNTRPFYCRLQQVQYLHCNLTNLRCSENFTTKHAASFHCGVKLTSMVQRDTPDGSNRDDIVTFIKDDNDVQRFLTDVARLLATPEFSKIKIPKEDAEAKLDEFVQRLIGMRADTRNIFAFLRSNPKVLNSKWDILMSNLQYLDELHLFGNRSLLVLDRNSKVWNASVEQLKERVKRLRKLGLIEGNLQRVITTWPSILTLKKNRLNGAVEVLRKCQFSSSQITTIIVNSPQVLDSDPIDIEHRFQYVYFTMGLASQDDMVQANLFKYPLEHIRRRHMVLDRLGVYEMPNKRGITRTDNPKLSRIIDSTDARFVEKCAGITLEEFQIFGRTLDDEAVKEEVDSAEEAIGDEFRDYDYETDR